MSWENTGLNSGGIKYGAGIKDSLFCPNIINFHLKLERNILTWTCLYVTVHAHLAGFLTVFNGSPSVSRRICSGFLKQGIYKGKHSAINVRMLSLNTYWLLQRQCPGKMKFTSFLLYWKQVIFNLLVWERMLVWQRYWVAFLGLPWPWILLLK